MTIQHDLPHAYREMQRIEAELAAKEAQKQQTEHDQAEAAMMQAEDSGDALALDMLKGTRQMYLARQQKARELIPLLRDFWAIQSDIRKQEGQALQVLRDSQRFSNPTTQDRFFRLRNSANLPDQNDLEVSSPTDSGEILAQTALLAIVAGHVNPGQIVVGSKFVNLIFKRDY